jgi:hypothetical protein
MLYLQKPSRKVAEMRKALMPVLQERFKAMSPHVIEMYLRRVINLEDFVTNQDTLSLIQTRNIFETLDKQAKPEAFKEVQPLLVYKTVERIIQDAKLSGRDSKVSSSRMIEKSRTD